MTRETSQLGRYEYCRYGSGMYCIQVFESPYPIFKAKQNHFLQKYSVHVTTWSEYSINWLEIEVRYD